MTDRICGLFVALDEDYRDDDVQCIIDAISMVRGVAQVTKRLTSSEDFLARSRVKLEVKKQLVQLFEAL